MAEYVVADTSVISRLTKVSKDSRAYQEILGGCRLAVSFQTPPELLGAQFGSQRQKRVNELLAVTLKLPHAESTDVWYARVAERRKQLKRRGQPGGDASDADVWVTSVLSLK